MSPNLAMSYVRDALSKTIIKPPNLDGFEVKGDPSKRLKHFFATPSHYKDYLEPFAFVPTATQ